MKSWRINKKKYFQVFSPGIWGREKACRGKRGMRIRRRIKKCVR